MGRKAERLENYSKKITPIFKNLKVYEKEII